MNTKKVSPAAIVIMAAGAISVIASFLAFYKFSFGGLISSRSFSAWSNNGILLFPLAVVPAILGFVMALQVAVSTFGDVKLPARILGFDWNQIHLVFAIQAALIMLCYLLADKRGVSYGIGFWLMLLASIALVVGAVMRNLEPASATGAPPAL